MWSVLSRKGNICESMKAEFWPFFFFRKKRLSQIESKKNNVKTLTGGWQKKGRQSTLAFCCIYYTIYSTININRPRENWKRKLYGHKMIYIRVKYTMQHGKMVKKKNITLQINLASEPMKPGQTLESGWSCLSGDCPEVSF